jgi:hypothetical protein
MTQNFGQNFKVEKLRKGLPRRGKKLLKGKKQNIESVRSRQRWKLPQKRRKRRLSDVLRKKRLLLERKRSVGCGRQRNWKSSSLRGPPRRRWRR